MKYRWLNIPQNRRSSKISTKILYDLKGDRSVTRYADHKADPDVVTYPTILFFEKTAPVYLSPSDAILQGQALVCGFSPEKAVKTRFLYFLHIKCQFFW